MPWKSGLPVLVMGVVLALTPSYAMGLTVEDTEAVGSEAVG